jgi:hypothetical protein
MKYLDREKWETIRARGKGRLLRRLVFVYFLPAGIFMTLFEFWSLRRIHILFHWPVEPLWENFAFLVMVPLGMYLLFGLVVGLAFWTINERVYARRGLTRNEVFVGLLAGSILFAAAPQIFAFGDRTWRQAAASLGSRLTARLSRYDDLTFEVLQIARAPVLVSPTDAWEKTAALLRELDHFAGPLDSSHGNAIHYSNIVLGRLALLKGRTAAAGRFLIRSATDHGPPQAGVLGPDMTLAHELLLRGETSAVLEYFTACKKVWRKDDERLLDGFTEAVCSGRIPDFGRKSGLAIALAGKDLAAPTR